MRFGKWSALLPPLIVVAGWTDVAWAQGTNDVLEAPAATEMVIEEGGSSRIMLASGILTFGSGVGDAAVVSAGNRGRFAEPVFGPFAILDSLFNPDKIAVARPGAPPAAPTIHVSPVALGAGGYGMLATATF
jgi:hypothetical protein